MNFVPNFLIGYIDPGTGGMLLQFLIAGILGISFRFRRGMASLWRKITGRKEPSSEENVGPTE